MGLGEINDICGEIRNATSETLEMQMAHHAQAERNHIISYMSDIREGLCEYYSDKYAYYQELPWVVAALNGGVWASMRPLWRDNPNRREAKAS